MYQYFPRIFIALQYQIGAPPKTDQLLFKILCPIKEQTLWPELGGILVE